MELAIFGRFHAGAGEDAAVDRVGLVAVQNVPSILDGKPIKDNVINKEVLE